MSLVIFTLPFVIGIPSFAALLLLSSAPFLGPAKEPSDLMTRWHGTTGDSGFLCSAFATARYAFGLPISWAILP